MSTDFSQQTVLVTGAAGFLGSHLVETLLKQSATVIGVDNFLTGQRRNLNSVEDHPQFTFIEADVTQPADTYLPANTPIDLILHFASPASPPRYQAHPVETYLVNSLATHHLLQFLLHHHPQGRLLFASTSEIYGDPLEHPQTEAYWGNVNPNGIRSCYDEAKRLGETICGVHHRDFQLDVRIVRIFNTFGPRMNLDDGRVIPQFIKEAMNQQPFSIQGDGQQTRSYCYVDDLINGILTFSQTPNLAGETINLGNPQEYTILETATIIAEAMKVPSTDHFRFLPLPKDDPTRRRPDISKAQSLLNWEPRISFKAGLEQTIQYFKSL